MHNTWAEYGAPALQSFAAVMQRQMTSKVASMEGRQAILAMAASPGTREVWLVLYASAHPGMKAAASDSSPPEMLLCTCCHGWHACSQLAW